MSEQQENSWGRFVKTWRENCPGWVITNKPYKSNEIVWEDGAVPQLLEKEI